MVDRPRLANAAVSKYALLTSLSQARLTQARLGQARLGLV